MPSKAERELLRSQISNPVTYVSELGCQMGLKHARQVKGWSVVKGWDRRGRGSAEETELILGLLATGQRVILADKEPRKLRQMVTDLVAGDGVWPYRLGVVIAENRVGGYTIYTLAPHSAGQHEYWGECVALPLTHALYAIDNRLDDAWIVLIGTIYNGG